MIDFLPTPTGPFALARLPEQLRPGCRVRADGRRAEIAGTIVCVDRVEAWLECLLRTDLDEPARWLAVEVRAGGYRTTLWDRSIETELPVDLRSDDAALLAGAASFRSRGDFGAFPIPRAGLLTYHEAHGAAATAAEQFAPDGPWLVGRGDGVDIALTADDKVAAATER
jgi:hypothetical protein